MISKSATRTLAVSFLLIVCCFFRPTQGIADDQAAATSKPMLVLQGPVMVTMAPLKDDCHDFELKVRYRQTVFPLRTFIVGVNNCQEALAVQKKHTRWKEPYLFVRSECGGGNAWRCDRDAIFAARSGQLVQLGEVYAGSRNISYQSYRNGYFWDVYDKLENNALTGHATAPFFWIALDEEGGHLKANLPRTWENNAGRYTANRAKIDAIIREKGDKSSRIRRLSELILSNAVLAAYCGRDKKVVEMKKIAKNHLPQESFKLFLDMLENVSPAEYPLEEDEGG